MNEENNDWEKNLHSSNENITQQPAEKIFYFNIFDEIGIVDNETT